MIQDLWSDLEKEKERIEGRGEIEDGITLFSLILCRTLNQSIDSTAGPMFEENEMFISRNFPFQLMFVIYKRGGRGRELERRVFEELFSNLEIGS